MATIRAYTTIEQSKKLAEILATESADMCYRYYSGGVITGYGDCVLAKSFITRKNVIRENDLPCWSLAALLSVLPKNLNIGRPSLDSNYMGYYWIQYYDEFMKPNNYKTECFNNPVDACVAMVEKLHELNLL